MRCFVECDGGGITLTFRGNHAIMKLDNYGITVTPACGDPDESKYEMVTGGRDDRVLRLYRVQ